MQKITRPMIMVLACMLLVLSMATSSLAETAAPADAQGVLEVWRAAHGNETHWYNPNEPEENRRFTQDADADALEGALLIAIDHIADTYAVPYATLTTHTVFVSCDEGLWQFDIVPEDAEQAYAIYVDQDSSAVIYAYYGAGEG